MWGQGSAMYFLHGCYKAWPHASVSPSCRQGLPGAAQGGISCPRVTGRCWRLPGGAGRAPACRGSWHLCWCPACSRGRCAPNQEPFGHAVGDGVALGWQRVCPAWMSCQPCSPCSPQPRPGPCGSRRRCPRAPRGACSTRMPRVCGESSASWPGLESLLGFPMCRELPSHSIPRLCPRTGTWQGAFHLGRVTAVYRLLPGGDLQRLTAPFPDPFVSLISGLPAPGAAPASHEPGPAVPAAAPGLTPAAEGR